MLGGPQGSLSDRIRLSLFTIPFVFVVVLPAISPAKAAAPLRAKRETPSASVKVREKTLIVFLPPQGLVTDHIRPLSVRCALAAYGVISPLSANQPSKKLCCRFNQLQPIPWHRYRSGFETRPPSLITGRSDHPNHCLTLGGCLMFCLERLRGN